MADSVLHFLSVDLDDLMEPGTCTVRRCKNPDGSTDWRLWFVVRDEIGPDVGTIVLLSVALNVGGGYVDGTPRRWGFIRAGSRVWQVSPSIDVADVWHHTPMVVDAPEPAPWEVRLQTEP